MFERDLALIRGVENQHKFVVLIYEGMTKAEACADMLINPAAVGFARRENAAFDTAIRDAEAFRVDMMTDKLATIHEDMDDAIMAGVVSKNIQWLASKRLREIYGDKQDITVNHNVSIASAMNEANKRTIDFIGYKVLENKPSLTDIKSVEQSSNVPEKIAHDAFE